MATSVTFIPRQTLITADWLNDVDQRLFEESINILDYGASPSASASTNTASINAAIVAANAAGGGIVYIPPGTYQLADAGGNTAISLLSNVTIRGAGRNASILYLANTADAHVINMSSVSNVSIEDLTIDGNRTTQTLQVHGIRSGGHTNLTIHNVEIKNAAHYGIGLQAGTQVGTWLDTIYISDPGGDGIDIKNKNDDNVAAMLSNIWVKNPSQNTLLTEQAGIDIRGPAKLTNIFITGIPATAIGVRFRNGELLDVNGLGAHTSSLSNFGIVCSSTSSTFGVSVVARNVQVSNGHIYGAQRGIQSVDENTAVSNVVAEECTDGFVATDSGTAGLTADNACFVNCKAIRATISASTRGFRVATSGNVARARISSCQATGFAEGIGIGAGATDTYINDCDLTGNTAPVNDSGTSTHARANVGYVTEACLESTSLTLDSTGSKTATIAHGLSVTPSPKHCTITHVRETAVADHAIAFYQVDSCDATNVVVRARVSTASATGGATFKLAVNINAKP